MVKYVYLILNEDTGLYKIGISKDVDVRLKALQTANGELLSIVETFASTHKNKVERAMHRTFRSKQTIGEWFRLDEDDVKVFEEKCQLYERNFDVIRDETPFYHTL